MADPAKQAAKKRKQLLAAMRRKLQNTLVNTQTLATDLWKLYRESDSDRSGRIEFDEFCEIMNGVGLGLNVLGHTSMAVLFQVKKQPRQYAVLNVTVCGWSSSDNRVHVRSWLTRTGEGA
jgi:hypothetical protein